jgi:hypothetical protein
MEASGIFPVTGGGIIFFEFNSTRWTFLETGEVDGADAILVRAQRPRGGKLPGGHSATAMRTARLPVVALGHNNYLENRGTVSS